MTKQRTYLMLALIIEASVSTSLTAQTSTATPSGAAKPEETLVLSPFVVDASKDVGYRAANTLAGSRLNTSLRDTASSVSVFTEEFLEDLGINQLEQLIAYTPSGEVGVQSQNAAPNANAAINGQSLTTGLLIRGIGSSQAIDYFKSITPNDSYRISRYDESRGPNGILFGISSAGGMINQTSYIAATNRDSGRISYQVANGASEGGRFEVRANKVIIPNKLALAVAAVDQQFNGWRNPDYQNKRRYFGTLTFMPNNRITVRVTGERGNELGSRVAPYGLADGLLGWLDNRNALGLSAVTYTPTGSNPTATQLAQGITQRNQALNTAIPGSRRFVYVENNGSFFNSGGTLLTGSYNTSTVKSPTGEPSVVVSNTDPLRLNLPGYLPYNLNSGGLGMYRDQDFHNYTFELDWRITDKLNFNFAHNYQNTELVSPVITGAQPTLFADPNRTQGVGGPANLFVGQFYIDATWISGIHTATFEESRAVLSYDLTPKPTWLGTHRLAGMASKSSDEDYYNARNFGVLGAVFSPVADDQTNRISQRIYLDENNPASFMAADWRNLPATVTTGGVTYNTGWINGTASTNNSTAEQDSTALVAVVQSRFWKDRVITTFGYREDEADITSYGLMVDPVTKQTVTNRAISTVDSVRGITRTQGVVYHATPWLSLIGNWSSNIGIPQFGNKVLPDGRTPSPSQGEGLDYGVAFQLLDNRIYMKAVYFETSSNGTTGTGGIAARYDSPNIRIANSLEPVLVGAGRPYTAEQWAPIRADITVPVNAQTFDQTSEGYEFTATANMTPNWRFTATYSYNDRVRANSGGVDVIPWYGFTYSADGKFVKQGVTTVGTTTTIDPSAFTPDGTTTQWLTLAAQAGVNLNTLTSVGSNPPATVAIEIQNIINALNQDKEVNEQRWGLRPHRASMFTAYDFKEGRWKGLTVGGGARWSSANINGTRADGTEIYGRPLTAIDLLLRYTHKVSQGFLRGTMSYQINVSNLLDQDGIVPQRFVDPENPEYQLPGGRGPGYTRFDFIQPRLINFTTTYSF